MTHGHQAAVAVLATATIVTVAWWLLHHKRPALGMSAPAGQGNNGVAPASSYNLNFTNPDKSQWLTATGYVPLFGFLQLAPNWY